MSELDDLENFEAYRQREMPIEFAKRATLAALRSSQPIARHLSGQVYDMIRDSQDAVSQKYQGVLTDEQRIVPEMHQSTLVPSPTLPLQSQSMLQLQTDQMSESNISYDPPKPHQPSHMCETDKTFIPEDLQYSNMSDLEFGLEEINTCFCMDPCTCLGAAPTCHPVETFPRESDPLLLQILQNISSRLAKLEQQSGDPISCPTKSISPSILAHPLSIDNAVFCSRSLEPITERAGNRNASVHNQEFLCNLSQLSKGLGSSANKSNDALNWDLIDFDILND
jgi:hypothetical protein